MRSEIKTGGYLALLGAVFERGSVEVHEDEDGNVGVFTSDGELLLSLALPDQVSEPVSAAQTDTQDNPEQVARRAAELDALRDFANYIRFAAHEESCAQDLGERVDVALADLSEALRRGEVKS